MGSTLATRKTHALLSAQFLGVAGYVWLLYGSVVEAVLVGGATVLLMYGLLLR